MIALLAYFGHRFLKLKEIERNSTKVLDTSNDRDVRLLMERNVDPELLNALRANDPRDKFTSIENHEKFDTNKLVNQSLAQNLASVCVDHPDAPALKKCAITDQSYCEHCITRQLDVWVAKKYLDVLLDSEWEEMFMLPDTKGHHDVKTRLKKIKTELWETKGIPLLIQGHYKINVEDDKIESYTVIKARTEDLKLLRKELSFLA